MKPPYPTEIIEGLNGLYGVQGDVTEMVDSVTYWLTPRKCSEQAPEYPCEMWDVEILEWIGIYEGDVTHNSRMTHWRPLPPGPTEEK